jgi:D-alanine-D-alanine ligase
MKNLRVAVLRGGPSDEYDVSMMTGEQVIASLTRQGVSVVDIIITKKGEWMVHGFERSPKDALAFVDVVFLALHGQYGEDGTVQRELDRLGIRYTGSRPYPSALAMNKILTKDALRTTGVKVAPHLRVTRVGTDIRRVAATIESLFGPSYIVKPVNGGSSIDTYKAHGVHELVRALSESLKKRDEVLVEQYIRGREATVGIVEGLRGERHYRLPVIEVVPPAAHGFFDYEVKYNGATEEICPGRFSRAEKEALEEAALVAHNTLGLSQYSRSDFIVSDKGIYFLETNTLPGLTSESLFSKALTAVGHSYDDLIAHLVRTAH